MAYEYKVMGKTIKLDMDPSVVAVRFHDPQPHSARASATAAAGVGSFEKRFEVPGEELTIVPVRNTGVGASAFGGTLTSQAAINALNQQAGISHALPVFRVGGNQVVASNRVIVGLDDLSLKDNIAAKHNLKILRETDDKIIFSIAEGASPFEVSSRLDNEVGVRFAEPDFVTIGRHIPTRIASEAPSVLESPPVQRQYAMQITQAEEAWKIQKGDRKVRIAILDDGVDTHHPDLQPSINNTYDATDNDAYQEPNSWDGHGTCCAGLAAALPHDTSGVTGAGAGCSILAVRIAFSKNKEGPWVTTNEVITRAINWSWQNEASILSNSWGGGAPSSAIAEEFEKARRRGRDGLGCVIVIAAGNSFGDVQFPANLPGVITVSASNEYDEAKTPTSKDGENWWGTCHGPEISVAAPGVHNLTTDINGSNGYDTGDYSHRFNGTSSSTPIVAGACGLVLSANENLSEEQVRKIIEQSAEKVGPYPYENARNNFFGYGRLNVMAAVVLAKDSVPQT